MSDDNDNDDLEVYAYRGNKGEEVPITVEKLIVNEGVQVLPEKLCYRYQRLREVSLPDGLIHIGYQAFARCQNLLEISICNTVQFIGNSAFDFCGKLRKVEFEVSTSSSPHQLQTIDSHAFSYCASLQRIKPPSSVDVFGTRAFDECPGLIEVNLSTTGLTEIPYFAFFSSSSLQTVGLPNTLQRIRDNAFAFCSELVTVVVPLDSSQSIKIGRGSFDHCRQLVNLVLPKGSTAYENSFSGCVRLQERYGDESSRIVAGLIGRFENFLIHRMCYDHSGTIKTTTVEELRQHIADQQTIYSPLFDKFKMTPFHILFSTIEPRVELLEVLLELLPNQLLKWKDANGRRPLDYLMRNWTDGTSSLVQRTLQKSMIGPLVRWGAIPWMEAIQSKVQELLVEDDNKNKRIALCNEAHSLFEHYEDVETTSILEMTLWKCKVKSGWTSDGSKRQALDRNECRCLSGADIVIPLVTTFLGIPRPTFGNY